MRAVYDFSAAMNWGRPRSSCSSLPSPRRLLQVISSEIAMCLFADRAVPGEMDTKMRLNALCPLQKIPINMYNNWQGMLINLYQNTGEETPKTSLFSWTEKPPRPPVLPFIHMIKSNLTPAPRFVQHTWFIHVTEVGRKENKKVAKALNLPGDFLPRPVSRLLSDSSGWPFRVAIGRFTLTRLVPPLCSPNGMLSIISRSYC